MTKNRCSWFYKSPRNELDEFFSKLDEVIYYLSIVHNQFNNYFGEREREKKKNPIREIKFFFRAKPVIKVLVLNFWSQV